MDGDKSAFLGEERLFPLLLKLSIPVTIGMLVNALYNVVDTVFVGHGVGPLAIAALAIAFPIQMLVSGIGQSIGAGAASIVSRRLGEKRPEDAARAVGTALSSVAVISVVATILLLVFAQPVLRFFGTSDSIMPYARDYMDIVAIGFFFLGISMAASNLIRAEGNPKVSMVGMIIGTALNIVLDPVFIFGLHMGVRGAAIATVISQICSAAYLVHFFVRRRGHIVLSLHHLVPRPDIFRDSFVLGLPSFIMQIGMSIVAIILNKSLHAYGGDLAISTYGMVFRLFSFIILPLIGLTQGFQPIAGYNYGARRYDRVRDIVKLTALAATLLSVGGFVVVEAFPRALMSLFTSDSELITSSSRALRIFFACAPIVGLQILGSIYFQAVGKAGTSLVLSLLRQFIILIPTVLILPTLFKLDGIWMSFPIADLISAVVTSIALTIELRRLTVKQEEAKEMAV